jgi:hypothetical protein
MIALAELTAQRVLTAAFISANSVEISLIPSSVTPINTYVDAPPRSVQTFRLVEQKDTGFFVLVGKYSAEVAVHDYWTRDGLVHEVASVFHSNGYETRAVVAQAQVTTTVSILRGKTDTAYGSEVDSSTAVVVGVPASVTKRSRAVGEPESRDEAYVREDVTVRVPVWLDVRQGDRLLDGNTGQELFVVSVDSDWLPGRQKEVACDTRKG